MQNKNVFIACCILALLAMNVGGLWFIYQSRDSDTTLKNTNAPIDIFSTQKNASELKAFSSAEEYTAYIADAHDLQGNGYSSFTNSLSTVTPQVVSTTLGAAETLDTSAVKSASRTTIDRFSSTNVQVEGIDEPDIIKTDGEQLYLSSEYRFYYRTMSSRPMIDIVENGMPSEKTHIIQALPLDKLGISSSVDESGELLLQGTTLLVISAGKIVGFDAQDPTSPKKIWTMEFSDNTAYESARLLNGTLYLITKTAVSESQPCPLEPMKMDGVGVRVECQSIYHPVQVIAADSTYTVMHIEIATGKVQKQIAMIGSPDNSVLYMSPDNLYLSYASAVDLFSVMYDFFTTDGKGLFPDTVVQKLKKVKEYDLSLAAKMMEFGSIMEDYQRSLSDDERLRLENEGENRMHQYMSVHKREVITSAISKISLDTFTVTATTTVPGTLLNQFSLDEYQNNLRVTTTVDNMGIFGFDISTESVNDLYVLDSGLQIVGKVEDLGAGEKIYSARFIGDKGYLVTFRQTDPFYVFDLSDPKNPQKTGELKIPGYSSYLHPISDTLILGVGKENSKVKLSLFDVSDPKNPQEVSKYILDEYWSDALNTQHAFLQDEKHQVFFIPGSQGAYVFSYAENTLELKVAVSETQARRAIYINDALYIVTDDKIVVLSETDWKQVASLDLE